MNEHDEHEHDDRHDRGLAFDLATLADRRIAAQPSIAAMTAQPMGRRRMLAMAGGTGLAAVVGSMAFTRRMASASTVLPSTVPIEGATSPIPEETGGPFPGDGSNGVNVLTEDAIVRSDITASFGSSTTVAGGVPLTVELLLTDTATGAALPGAAVYLWHCDREGRYSLYSQGVENENYLRGVQAAGDDGIVTFTTIFPGCYAGRWPHMHFEIYPTLHDALATSNIMRTSQLALPKDTCDVVYAEAGYEQSIQNLAQTSLATDMVFRDDQAALQVATVTGSVASLAVGI